MKALKFLFLLIIVIVVSGLAYQNLEYFKHAVSLKIDIKDFSYVIPEIPNGAYLGICFLLGLIYSGMSVLSTRWELKKVIQSKDDHIAALNNQVGELKIDLNFFTNDPYIKKGLEDRAGEAAEPADPLTDAGDDAPAAAQPEEMPAEQEETAAAGTEVLAEETTGDTAPENDPEKQTDTV